EKYSLPPRARARVEKSTNPALTRPLREFWEATDLSAAEFADEVADYFGLDRLGLPQLLATTPCLDGFSRRFLRESTIFPFRAPRTAATGWRSPTPPTPPPSARPRSCSACRSRPSSPRSRTSRRSSTSAPTPTTRTPTTAPRGRSGNPTTISRACATSRAAR